MFTCLRICLFIVITTQMNAMQDPMQIDEVADTKQSTIHFFSKLPHEVWDLIAYYLTFNDIETEKEFIERTKKMSTIGNDTKLSSEKIHAHQVKYTGMSSEGYKTSSLIKYYPRVNKMAILQAQRNQSTLSIVTADTEQELYKMSFNSGQGCHYLTGSSDAKLFAAIHSELDNEAMGLDEVIYYKDVLTIMNIVNQQKQVCAIPISLPSLAKYPSAIAFNKQKTHAIMHGIDHEQLLPSDKLMILLQQQDGPILHHLIIPLTIASTNTPVEKKNLQHYFAHKGICKQILQ